jgi:hypothetical protein
MRGAAAKRARSDEEAAQESKKRRANLSSERIVDVATLKPEMKTNDENDSYWEVCNHLSINIGDLS